MQKSGVEDGDSRPHDQRNEDKATSRRNQECTFVSLYRRIDDTADLLIISVTICLILYKYFGSLHRLNILNRYSFATVIIKLWVTILFLPTGKAIFTMFSTILFDTCT